MASKIYPEVIFKIFPNRHEYYAFLHVLLSVTLGAGFAGNEKEIGKAAFATSSFSHSKSKP